MLSPSLMCADPLNVQQELTVLDNLGVDYIHLDFMDNHFVPNLTLSPELIKATKKVLRHMKRDIHIMAVEPQQYFDRMDIGEGDIVAVHYEACPDLGAVLADIRQRGATPAIAISPDTEPGVLTEWLGKIGMVLVMTVYPGFAGRPIVPGSMEKLAAVRRLIDESGFHPLLEVDGHVSWELCREMRACGADMFVAGSSSLYQEGLDIGEAVARMSELVK
jgi:ribulose-phosphate 3-epimerase